ncbi:putative O-glycosylation ligase, exosortase A system-associated [Kordiimonas sp. SCSIO 12603]|uniref:putative O-glycosylation ligase, exosortase A system-associated n=1 Tax=Kordiimonas sp. SCSIO 12603 TaxID=2829596 RepID=UPI00210785F1|nr:putative O-glycosylation ligase, exosortase A system-associated [Kordiimonas sp. SCSIO 12603]UTW58608.1 putative O-glycosylation ligase, exosortase A system-associated [Kordiimonas sp. SCSIO 12603]
MRGLLVALMIFIWMPLAVFKPQIGVLVWSWVSHMAPQSYTYNFARGFPFLVTVAAVTIIGMFLSRDKNRLVGHPAIVAMLIYWAWVVTTTFTAMEPSVSQTKLIHMSKVMLFAILSTVIMQSANRLKAFVWVMFASLAFIGIKGGLFTVLTGGNSRVQGAGGMMGDNNQLAMAMSMLLPFAIYMAMHPPAKILKWPLRISAILIPISVVGTHSRGGFVALAGVIGMLVLKTKRKFLTLLVIAVVGATAITFMPQSWKNRIESTEGATEDSSFIGRVSMWKFSTNVVKDEPVFGGGFDIFYVRHAAELWMPPGYKARAPHSIYFEVLAEHGYTGLILFLTMLFTGWYAGGTQAKLYQRYEETKWIGDLCWACQLSMVAYAIGGLTVNIATFDVFYHILAILVMSSVVGEQLRAGKLTLISTGEVYGAKQENTKWTPGGAAAAQTSRGDKEKSTQVRLDR